MPEIPEKNRTGLNLKTLMLADIQEDMEILGADWDVVKW